MNTCAVLGCLRPLPARGMHPLCAAHAADWARSEGTINLEDFIVAAGDNGREAAAEEEPLPAKATCAVDGQPLARWGFGRDHGLCAKCAKAWSTYREHGGRAHLAGWIERRKARDTAPSDEAQPSTGGDADTAAVIVLAREIESAIDRLLSATNWQKFPLSRKLAVAAEVLNDRP